MKIRSFDRSVLWLCLSLCLSMVGTAQTEELTLENTLRISGDLLRVSTATMQSKIDFARQTPNDRDAVMDRFAELDTWSQSQNEEVYTRYKTTLPDYMAFSAKNRIPLQDYLSDHADMRTDLEKLEDQ